VNVQIFVGDKEVSFQAMNTSYKSYIHSVDSSHNCRCNHVHNQGGGFDWTSTGGNYKIVTIGKCRTIIESGTAKQCFSVPCFDENSLTITPLRCQEKPFWVLWMW